METLTFILSLPLTNVIMGAIIAGSIALITSYLSIGQQSRSLEIGHLSHVVQRLTEILNLFEPIQFLKTGDGQLGQTKTHAQVYETVRTVYFKNEALIPLPLRDHLRKSYVRAEVAYLLLHCRHPARSLRECLLPWPKARVGTRAIFQVWRNIAKVQC